MCVSYILYADSEISLEVTEVLCQLVTVVIVGEQALEKRQQLRETKRHDSEGSGGVGGRDKTNDKEREREERREHGDIQRKGKQTAVRI